MSPIPTTKNSAPDFVGSGVFALDKPAGRSSAQVLAECKHRFGMRRIGHAGTLDPMATGVLVVLVGEATKLQSYLMAGRKTYVAEICFGATTDSLDADGKITDTRDAAHVTEAALRAVLPRFVGTIAQVPPSVSAIHVDGERAYDLARAGKPVELAARAVEVYALSLDAFTPGTQPRARITLHCGKGTYVRSLARDLATAVDSIAHLTALRRTQVGAFFVDDAYTLAPEKSELPSLCSLWDAIPELPAVELTELHETWARQGKSINLAANVHSDAPVGTLVRLGRDGRLCAVAEQTPGGLTLLRVFS